jgi:hypothetical protein
VVTNQLSTLLLLGDDDGALVVFDTPKCVTDGNVSFVDKIHFRHFLILVIDNSIDLAVIFEDSGHEPERDIVHEFAILGELYVKEALAAVKNVGEQVELRNLLLNVNGKDSEHAIMRLEAGQPICGPKVIHIHFYIIRKRLRQRGLIGEACQGYDPPLELIRLVDRAHLGLLALDDLNEVTHDE